MNCQALTTLPEIVMFRPATTSILGCGPSSSEKSQAGITTRHKISVADENKRRAKSQNSV